MLLWSDDQIALLDRMLLQVRAGQPSLLLVQGEPGTGKTSLLGELVRRAPEFQLLAADGRESEDSPSAYAMLGQFGVPVDGSGGGPASPFVMAQQLRERLDRLPAGPVLLHADDTQWADPESVEALRWLLARADGDRILIAVGTRPPDGPVARALDHLAESSRDVARIALSGLSEQQATTLIDRRRPGLSSAAATRLIRHTDGNPLYLNALLEEFDPEALSSAYAMLPAPAGFAQIVGHRLDRLDRSARVFLEALAVLGDGWTAVADVAAVARSSRATATIQALVTAGLVKIRSDTVPAVRPSHALVRAAVYHQTPLELRQVLHRRAADLAALPAALDHRLAAADTHDAELAGDLEVWATRLHDELAFRQAAHYFAAAAEMTDNRTDRERCHLESLWNRALVGESPVGAVELALPSVVDRPRAHAIEAFARLHAGDVRGALRVLGDLHGPEIRRAELLVRFRVGVLTAYLRMLLAHPTEDIVEALASADALGVEDIALAAMISPTRGFMAARHFDGGALDFLSTLPDDPHDFRPEQERLLIWRGLFRASNLQIEGAIADFEASVDLAARRGNPVQHQIHLGEVRWYAGEWTLARVAFEVGVDRKFGASSWLPDFNATLLASSQGRFADADAVLDVAVDRSRVIRWPEHRLLLLTAVVVRCHAAGAPADQVGRLAASFADLADLLDYAQAADDTILIHAALAALWSERRDVLDHCLAKLHATTVAGPSHPAMVGWIEGLAAEQAGDLPLAARLLHTAATDPANELPLYRAHQWADHAAVAAATGDAAAADRSRREAYDLYRRLGAAPYVERLEALLEPCLLEPGLLGPGAGQARSELASDYRPELTTREQEVLTLAVTGLSYAQIAKALFVSQSTVGFHLSKLYAKFDVGSRHELTALVRGGR